MARQWINSKRFKGIRWTQHPTRKNGVRFDRNFGYRFMCQGIQYESVLGWESEGWTEGDAYLKRQEYLSNTKKDIAPRSPSEEDELSRKAVAAKRAKQISFEDYFDKRYLPEASTRKKEKTLRVEKQHVRDWLAPRFGGKPIHKISPDDVEAIKLAILDAGRAPRTAQHVLAVFRLVWNHARKRGIVSAESPTRVIEMGKIKNARTRFLKPDEARKLLKTIEKRDKNAYRLTLAALYTGARLGELSALTWANVDFEEKSITLKHTKTGEVRALPMAKALHEALSRLKPGSSDSPVFTDSRKESWKESPYAFRKAVEDLKFNEGVTDRRDRICFHTLRHSAASMMLASGVDVRTIQTHFGWSTLAMLQRYTHALDESKRAAVDSLENALDIKKGKVITLPQARKA